MCWCFYCLYWRVQRAGLERISYYVSPLAYSISVYRDGKAISSEPIPVTKQLEELNAYCSNNKLFDGSGREIKSFSFTCYGNRPVPEEIIQKETEELKKLSYQFTVIVPQELCA